MADDLWQFAKADGDPDWTPGSDTYGHVWDRAYDLLRFHRGEGFEITNRETGETGPKRRLKDVEGALKTQLTQHVDTVFEVRSVADRNYALVFRRRGDKPDSGDRWVQVGERMIGTPYVFGGMDCSGLTQEIASNFDIFLPHNARMQHDLFRSAQGMRLIKREQIEIGDMLWHWNDDHVSTYVGKRNGVDAVLDTEPHDTGAPRGWPTQNLGTGCRIRPMVSGYYCDWEHVNGIGRIVKINGAV